MKVYQNLFSMMTKNKFTAKEKGKEWILDDYQIMRRKILLVGIRFSNIVYEVKVVFNFITIVFLSKFY